MTRTLSDEAACAFLHEACQAKTGKPQPPCLSSTHKHAQIIQMHKRMRTTSATNYNDLTILEPLHILPEGGFRAAEDRL